MTAVHADIPFLDLAAQHAEIADELDEAWAKVTSTNGFIGGYDVAEFEAEFAKYCGVSECVGVANGTDALELILRALGIGPGDEIIVPANTFVATVEAIVAVGATPVFVDVDDDTLLVAAAHIEAAITPRTAAAIVVHLYGQMPDMDAIAEVTERAGIALIEDAAQAQGARWLDRRAGSFGHAAAFSFYPGKNLGAFGDAGAVTTNDAGLTERIRSSRRPWPPARRPARARGIGAQQPARRAPGRDPVDQARAPRRLERLAPRGGRPVSHAPGRYKLPGAPGRSALDPRAPSGDRPGGGPAERARARSTHHGIGWGLHYPIPCHRQQPFTAFATSRRIP